MAETLSREYYNTYFLNIHKKHNKLKEKLLRDKIISIALEYNESLFSNEIKHRIDKRQMVKDEYETLLKNRDYMMEDLSAKKNG